MGRRATSAGGSMAAEWPSFFMHIAAGPGRAYTAVPFEIEEDGRACRYNLRLLQADQFVVSEQVLLRDLPSEVSPAEQRRYVLEQLEAWLPNGPDEATLLALRVQAGKLPLSRLQVAARCGYGPAGAALSRLSQAGLPTTQTSDYPAQSLLVDLAAHDGALATVALCAMLVDLATRLPGERLPEAAAPALAALASWQAQPDASSVQAATAALTLLPPAEAGRYRPAIYRALERAVDSLSPPHAAEGLVAALRHALDWASGANLPYRFAALEALLVPTACRAVLATCLGYAAQLPAPEIPAASRFEVVTQTHDHGDIYELEQDTIYYVVDRRTGQAVMEFRGHDYSTYDGTWQHQSSSGVASVTVSADGTHVLVREAGAEQRLPIPGSEAPPPPASEPAKPTAPPKSRRSRRRRGAQTKSEPSGPECPRCGGRDRTACVQTDLLEGSLEFYYLVHTEVRYHYHCAGCKTDWSETAYL